MIRDAFKIISISEGRASPPVAVGIPAGGSGYMMTVDILSALTPNSRAALSVSWLNRSIAAVISLFFKRSARPGP
ncbi:hypothetical protein [Lactococcus cremoris]|uniref:hypothetical protein n=1 Tax=Lactococcus lactis subsp. cremoris TaxID=1359 RepID=UPI002F260500